jgi:NAD(P)-dependent dehydrogenase (short-subunit alcohol dehydrogenase family)
MKTIILTGANGNLGTAAVRKFLDAGYTVLAVDAGKDHLEFAAGNKNFEFQAVNLTNETETAGYVSKAISKYVQIDAAILLVGGFEQGNIQSTSGADIQKQISLNFETAYFVAKPLLQHFHEKGVGRLVFIGARPALNPIQGKDLLAYGLSKSLLFKLAEFINEENKGKNITATVVVPSTIDTPLNRKYSTGVNFDDWVKPEQLAETIEFIISDKGSALRENVLKVYNNA